ncbi:MAG: cupin domain-containing protein [Myxococcota bacterium]
MNPTVAQVVAALDLKPHPEGGYYREVFRSDLTLPLPRGTRATCTSIHFLLPAGAFSAWHRVRSDEIWVHHDGDPLELHLLDDTGRHTLHVLGRDHAAGQVPSVAVPAGLLQAATPRGERYALCACVVAPGFDFADFAMPSREVLSRAFPGKVELVERFTR